MNVHNAGPVQRCERCGQEWLFSHYCPATNKAPGASLGAVPLPTLTEQRVREIVREELARDIAERREKLRALMADDGSETPNVGAKLETTAAPK